MRGPSRPRITHYKLIGRLPVPCADLQDWAAWMGTVDCHVDDTMVAGLRVSTVFLSLDHQWGNGPPILFETMIFGDDVDEYQTRCSTWDEAERMHAAACVVAASWVARAATIVMPVLGADSVKSANDKENC